MIVKLHQLLHSKIWRRKNPARNLGKRIQIFIKAHAIDPKKYEQALRVAEICEASGKHGEAYVICNKIDDRQISFDQAIRKLLVLLRLGVIEDAAELMSSILAENNMSGLAQEKLILALEVCDDSSIDRIGYFLEKLDGPEGYYFIGRMYFVRHLYSKVLSLFGTLGGGRKLATKELELCAKCHLELNEIAEAERCYKKIISMSPRDKIGLLGLAVCQFSRNTKLAIENCKQLVSENDEYFPAVWQLALWNQAIGDHSEAELLFRKAIELKPGEADSHFRLGEILAEQGQEEEAIHELELAFSLDARLFRARLLIAKILSKNDVHNSLALIEATLTTEQHANNIELLLEKARYLHQAKDLDGAIHTISVALDIDNGVPALHSTHAALLRESGQIEEAFLAINKAAELAPEVHYILVNRGAILSDLGRWEEAVLLFEKALEIDPEDLSVHWYRAICFLAHGMYYKGWKDYEYRWTREEIAPRQFDFQAWSNSGSVNTVLVYREQGLGDEIMFASCVPDLDRLVNKVILECHPKLEKLFMRSFPGIYVVGNKDALDTQWAANGSLNIEAKVAVGSLPMHFRNSLESFGGGMPYLCPDENKVSRWGKELARFEGKRLIGLSWRGGVYVTRTGIRSVPLGKLELLFELPNTEFFSLQYGEVQDDLVTIDQNFGVKIHHFQNMVDDYDETAAFLANMDVVVSVQTSLVHLCGALGVPVLCMLPKVPEWRYGYTGDSMPWYASVRLFRQQSSGDWSDVLENVCATIEQDFK